MNDSIRKSEQITQQMDEAYFFLDEVRVRLKSAEHLGADIEYCDDQFDILFQLIDEIGKVADDQIERYHEKCERSALQ